MDRDVNIVRLVVAGVEGRRGRPCDDVVLILPGALGVDIILTNAHTVDFRETFTQSVNISHVTDCWAEMQGQPVDAASKVDIRTKP